MIAWPSFPEIVRKLCASLLPSWERRSALACSRFSAKAKNLAWDLADNPFEISIEGEVAKAQSVLKETWKVAVESKLKFLIGLLAREKPSRVCIFCNLKDTASDLMRRLSANGFASDTIFGALSPERKFALIEKFRAGDCTCLVISDEGAEGLTPGVFPLVVNYDIPLEPELFVKRIEMLDRSDPGAKVVSIACDRYIYGLPAVEQYIDAKLDAVAADDSMLGAVDASVGSVGVKRQRDDSYSKDGRRPHTQRRDGNRREEIHPRDAYPRDGRSSPDIRKSISEATGGALDMGGAHPTNRPEPQSRSTKGSARQPQIRQGGPSASSKNAKPNQNPRGESRRGSFPREGGKASGQRAPQPGQSPARPTTAKSGSGLPGNPYDVPMEERMKLYREKYGRHLGDKDPRKSPKKGPAETPQQRRPAQSAKGRGPTEKGIVNLPRDRVAPSKPQEPRPVPQIKPVGIVGRILGGFLKKKD